MNDPGNASDPGLVAGPRPSISNWAIGSLVFALSMFPNVIVAGVATMFIDSWRSQNGYSALFTNGAFADRGVGLWLFICLLIWPGIIGVWCGVNGLDDVKYNGRTGKRMSIVGIVFSVAIAALLVRWAVATT